MSSDLKDWLQGILHIFQKRTIIVFAVIFGSLSLCIILYGDHLKIFNKNIDLSEFIKNPLNILYLSSLGSISILFTFLLLKIWDLFVWVIQKIKKQWTICQEDKLKESQEAKLKEELKKLPIDEKEFLLRAVIKFEKKTSSQDKWITKALEDKKLIVVVPSFNSLDERITYRVTIHDFVFDELEKELSHHIEEELNNLEDSEKHCLLDCYQEGQRFVFQSLEEAEKSLLSKKLLLVGGNSIAIIPQMVWDRLHLLQDDENNTDLNKS